MAMRPAAPAIPAPTSPVGREAPPVEELDLAEVVAAAVVAAALVRVVLPELVAVVVELPNLTEEVVPLEYPVVKAAVGTAAAAAVMKYVWTSAGSLVNQVGVPVANSEEMMEAAPTGSVRATFWIEDGRAPKRAMEAEAGSTARSWTDATAAPTKARTATENCILILVQKSTISECGGIKSR